jgi:predicted ATPase
VLLVIATRPVPREDAPPELARISAREGTSVLRLEALAADETARLVCQLLRARRLERTVERLILQKAEGHPFFTEELAHALRDRGLVRIDDGVCRFSGAAAADESVLLPSTVRVMVGSRIDQLTLAQQLTAKVASVFGRTFDLESLGAIYPVDLDRGELAEHVRALEARELIRAAPTASPQAYEFKHAIIQEVAYSLLPYAQRSPLHAAAARFYERRHASDLVRFYPLLATHWGRAGVKERTRFYCEKAGHDALDRFANEEAVRLLQEALAIDASADGTASPVPDVALPGRVVSGAEARRAQLRRCLGEAYVNLGMWTEGWTQLADSLSTDG